MGNQTPNLATREFNSIAADLQKRKSHLIDGLANADTLDFMDAHTVLLDDYFRSSFELSSVGLKMGITQNPYAVVALGGYGRSEQCVHSDVDLLFLFDKKIPEEAEALVREVIYPLWDLGMDVSHATRSIKESVQLASEDYEVLTSILDARFICGISPVYIKLMEKIRTKIIKKRPENIINWLIETNQARHQRFGDSAYLLKPNLKEGQGGLRDYHTMLWISRIKSNVKERRDLEYFGYFSHEGYRELMQALSFVWRVRNQLHLTAKRKCDQLHLDYQTKLAKVMNIKGENGHLPVEMLLGELHSHMEFIKQHHLLFIYEMEQLKKLKRKNRVLKTTDVPGLKFNRGMLNFTSSEDIVKSPDLLIKIFLESTFQKTPICAEAAQLVKHFNYLIEDKFRSSREITQMFEQILLKPAPKFNVLNQMLHTGFLGQYIPEFKGIINRIQFNQYHMYPVARHLLSTVRILKSFASKPKDDSDTLLYSLYREIKNKRVLLWSALLHDIGKDDPESGHANRGAKTTDRILQKRNFKATEIETVCFLVKEHLLLVLTATRRDIDDEETSLTVARKIKTLENLKMLYLLTVADSMATGPKAWNDWTSSLLKSLFLKTAKTIASGELSSRWAIKEVESKQDKILSEISSDEDKKEFQALFQMMSPRYLLYTPVDLIPQHVDMFKQLDDRGYVWNIEKSADLKTRTVTICAKDRPGLLSKFAGIFTLNNINILNVRIFTWRNNIALDIFDVTPPKDLIFEEERWNKAAKQLERALKEEIDLSAELIEKRSGFKSLKAHTTQKPQQVIIDNDSSSFFTIIEVYAWDFPGLLFKITNTLFQCKLNIWVAKIATELDQVVDVFYVRDFNGQKVDEPQQVEKIKAALETIIEE